MVKNFLEALHSIAVPVYKQNQRLTHISPLLYKKRFAVNSLTDSTHSQLIKGSGPFHAEATSSTHQTGDQGRQVEARKRRGKYVILQGIKLQTPIMKPITKLNNPTFQFQCKGIT
jgi:hypothetical protein